MKAIRFWCVNKDLLIKKVSRFQKKAGPLKSSYTICKKLTKDTNGDGQLTSIWGVLNTPGKEALAANGGHLPAAVLKLDSAPEVKEFSTFSAKLKI